MRSGGLDLAVGIRESPPTFTAAGDRRQRGRRRLDRVATAPLADHGQVAVATRSISRGAWWPGKVWPVPLGCGKPFGDGGSGVMLGKRTLAQLYALAVAPALVVTGLLGFFFDSSFGAGGQLHGNTDLILELNGWHNALHFGFGVVGLGLLRSPRLARLFALSWGSTALLLLVWGFASRYPVAGLVPVNTADNYFHILDATGILVAILSPRDVPRLLASPSAR